MGWSKDLDPPKAGIVPRHFYWRDIVNTQHLRRWDGELQRVWPQCHLLWFDLAIPQSKWINKTGAGQTRRNAETHCLQTKHCPACHANDSPRGWLGGTNYWWA